MASINRICCTFVVMKLDGTTFTINVIHDDGHTEQVSYDLLNVDDCLDCVETLQNTIEELVDQITSINKENYVRACN